MTVRNAILGLLAQRPRHGYELRAAFEALVGGEDFWDVKPAQVYTTLARLEESGFVRQAAVDLNGGPEKRVYELTPAGQQELESWFLTGVPSEHHRDEFYIKLMLSLNCGAASPLQIIHAQRSSLYQELHDLTVHRNAADPKTGLAQVLLLDKATMHIEADLRWLDMIETRLDEIQRQPMPEPEIRPRGRPRKSG